MGMSHDLALTLYHMSLAIMALIAIMSTDFLLKSVIRLPFCCMGLGKCTFLLLLSYASDL